MCTYSISPWLVKTTSAMNSIAVVVDKMGMEIDAFYAVISLAET